MVAYRQRHFPLTQHLFTREDLMCLSLLRRRPEWENADVVAANSDYGNSCAGFSDAGLTGLAARTMAGVGEAPRHEVAGGGALSVQRALRGGAPVGIEFAK